jgi:hypothetical protein
MATFNFGNADDLYLTVNTNYDTYIFGNGTNDAVAAGPYGYDTITLGNGNNDLVDAVEAHNDTITLGNGTGDTVNAGLANNNIITLGNGVGDTVNANPSSNNIITLGNGAGDMVNADGSDNFTITLGNGAGDTVNGGATMNDTITLGNGKGDQVTLGPDSGGDYIATGTGAGDTVTVVGPHTSFDTLAFALGTNGTKFTTVSGAAVGDHVVVNGGQLGNTLASGATTHTTLASYISSLTLTKGETYVGFNATADDTFVVTDTASGQTGAIELTGVAFQHSTLAHHVLTLA